MATEYGTETCVYYEAVMHGVYYVSLETVAKCGGYIKKHMKKFFITSFFKGKRKKFFKIFGGKNEYNKNNKTHKDDG